MKVAELLETRSAQWEELETLCRTERAGARSAEVQVRFARLYRAACADLALADAYQLPPDATAYLHELVGRAHNRLYRRRRFQFAQWGRELISVLPQRLYRDRCLRLALVLFWGVFGLCALLAYRNPGFAQELLGAEQVQMIEEMYSERDLSRSADASASMFGFYSRHNSTIGLRSFAFGLLFGVGGLLETVFNAALLGAIHGYMATAPEWTNFRDFVTAHGPIELTAIVLSAAAGMRLGFALVATGGLKRTAALRRAAAEAAPTISAAVLLFILAGLIEAFVSPWALPYPVKLGVAAVSALLLLFYYLVLGARKKPEARS